MTPQDAWLRFKALPLLAQIGAGVAVLLVVLWLAGALEGAVSHARDWIFDRGQAQAEAERDQARVERDAAIDRAEAAEAQAVIYQAQVDAQKELLKQSGARIRAADKVVDDVVQEMEDEIRAVGADTATPDERAARIRKRLADLGYLPK